MYRRTLRRPLQRLFNQLTPTGWGLLAVACMAVALGLETAIIWGY